MALCTSQQLSAFALERCAKTCGLCDKPGSAGGCPDTSEGCDLLRAFNSIFKKFYGEDNRIKPEILEEMKIWWNGLLRDDMDQTWFSLINYWFN